jgi:hypothetical protein
MASGRALGMGLLAGAAGILVLMLLWLLVSGARGGGIVLGLLLTLVLVGPLAGGGWYVLSRQSVEQASAAAFATRRRVLDADRLFRAEIGDALHRLAERPGLPAADLHSLADELQGSAHRGVAWEETVQLDDAGLARLSRYDDLVRERVRRMRDTPPDEAPRSMIRELRQALDQREDLLLRGRAAPALDAAQLLRADAPRADSAELQQLAVGDAVTHEGTDYIVESLGSYFAEGQTWKLARLVPTGGEIPVNWLYIGPGGLDVALMAELPASATDAPPGLPGAQLAETGAGTAVVDVSSKAGDARGVLVAYTKYRDPAHLALVEHWPDDVRRAYAGSLVKRDDLQVWPAVRS